MFSRREQLLLRLPVLAPFFYIFIGMVVLPAVGVYTVIPFGRWEMFSVPPGRETVFFLRVKDAKGGLICGRPACPRFYSQDQQGRVFDWAQLMGYSVVAGDKAAAEIWRARISAELKERGASSFTLVENDDFDWSRANDAAWSDGKELETF